MIPADHTQFGDDGTEAWVVADDPRDVWGVDEDPCDTCDTCEERHPDGPYFPEDLKCPDRIDGRHTFTIKVECEVCDHLRENYTDAVDFGGGCPNPRICRVSVIPGMVLPLLDGDTRHEVYPPNAIYWTENQGWWVDSDFEHIITLPPAAAPGLWAVKLKVA